ncbi:MAG: hypothetical protein LLG04_07045 [Parachlamydia sp.]|nr:hypothetical protein [Parachlamydia sp.]
MFSPTWYVFRASHPFLEERDGCNVQIREEAIAKALLPRPRVLLGFSLEQQRKLSRLKEPKRDCIIEYYPFSDPLSPRLWRCSSWNPSSTLGLTREAGQCVRRCLPEKGRRS